jgi:hypothetical protein
MVKYDLCYYRSDRVRFNFCIALNRHQPGGIASIEATEIVASFTAYVWKKVICMHKEKVKHPHVFLK